MANRAAENLRIKPFLLPHCWYLPCHLLGPSLQSACGQSVSLRFPYWAQEGSGLWVRTRRHPGLCCSPRAVRGGDGGRKAPGMPRQDQADCLVLLTGGGGCHLPGWSSLVLPPDLRAEPRAHARARPPAPTGCEVQNFYSGRGVGVWGGWGMAGSWGCGLVGRLVLEAVEQFTGFPL